MKVGSTFLFFKRDFLRLLTRFLAAGVYLLKTYFVAAAREPKFFKKCFLGSANSWKEKSYPVAESQKTGNKVEEQGSDPGKQSSRLFSHEGIDDFLTNNFWNEGPWEPRFIPSLGAPEVVFLTIIFKRRVYERKEQK